MKRTSTYFVATLFLIGLCFACVQQKIKTTKTKPEEKTAFYDFKFKYDSLLKKTNITINAIKIVDTKIVYTIDESAREKASNVLIEITDTEGNAIKACIEHPLYRKFDVYEESGKIESKLVSLAEGDMTIRVPYYAPYKKIKITETIKKELAQTIILKNEK